MPEIYTWNELDENDRKMILEFTMKNNARIGERVRGEFPNLYIGRADEEVAKGWLMIAGLSAVKRFMNE